MESVHKVSTNSTQVRTKARPPARFTASQIAGLQPTGKTFDLADPLVRGLVLRIGPTGTKRWLFRYKWKRNPVRIALGAFPETTLAAARDLAIANGGLLKRGIDPRRAERSTRYTLAPDSPMTAEGVSTAPSRADCVPHDIYTIPPPAADDKISVHFLAYEYVELYVKRSRRDADQVIRILNKDVLSYWRERDARTINSREVIERLDEIVKRGAPIIANQTADILGQMFKYGIHRCIVENSPVQLLFRPGGKAKKRKRFLKDEEITKFLHGLPALCTKSPQRNHTLRVLLLTTVRRGSLALAEWPEFDFESKEWHIPAEHDKEGQEHVVPLTDWAIEELLALKALSNGSRHVLPNKRGNAPADPEIISRSVARMQEGFQAIGIAKFVTHDLRRTGRTLMSRLGVLPHIAERVLNHKMGEVDGTYDLYQYLGEKREALTRLEQHLTQLEVAPRRQPSADVILAELFKAKLKKRKHGVRKRGLGKKTLAARAMVREATARPPALPRSTEG